MIIMKPQLFVHYNKPSDSHMKPVVNGYTCKPSFGGIWTSTYMNGTSAWIEFCKKDCSGDRQVLKQKLDGVNHYILYPSVHTKIFRVDSIADCLILFNVFGISNVDFPKDNSLMTLDFQRIQSVYDGIHLTRRGEFETRDKFSFPNLHGWDCESTLWFRWSFVFCESLYECEPPIKKKKRQK
jgi:hypothetical protein